MSTDVKPINYELIFQNSPQSTQKATKRVKRAELTYTNAWAHTEYDQTFSSTVNLGNDSFLSCDNKTKSERVVKMGRAGCKVKIRICDVEGNLWNLWRHAHVVLKLNEIFVWGFFYLEEMWEIGRLRLDWVTIEERHDQIHEKDCFNYENIYVCFIQTFLETALKIES